MTALDDTTEALWARPRREQPISSGEDYIASLRGRNLAVHYLGELVDEPVDHPVIRPSINAVARTYDLAIEQPELASAYSEISGRNVNRLLHIAMSPEEVVAQNRMQRTFGDQSTTYTGRPGTKLYGAGCPADIVADYPTMLDLFQASLTRAPDTRPRPSRSRRRCQAPRSFRSAGRCRCQ